MSLVAFDLHRTGSYRKGRRCSDPRKVSKLAQVESSGRCDVYSKPEKKVTVWGTP